MWPIESGVPFAVIPSIPGYRYGHDGRVWSCWVRGSKRHRMVNDWHEVKSRPNTRRQYLYVTLKTPAGTKHFRVNVLILWAFTGWRPVGLEAAHKDGDRLNNHIDNLEWKTRLENIGDKVAHGTMRRGRQISCAKLDEASVARIKVMCKSQSYASLGRMFGVSWSSIRAIADGKTWKHVEAAS